MIRRIIESAFYPNGTIELVTNLREIRIYAALIPDLFQAVPDLAVIG